MELVLPGPEVRAPPPLADHLLEEIFVRISAPTDLARASAACKAFRRLITDSAFLRWYRSLHPPLLLGFVFPGSVLGFLPADAPAALAPAGVASFSIDHLPDRGPPGWLRCDARHGLVLLMSAYPERGLVLPELAVCDPLTRGYTLLPPIPDGLLASVSFQIQNGNINYIDAFFDPSESYNEAQFRLMCWSRCPTMGAIFIYSSVSGSWTHGTSISWDALGLDVDLLQPENIDIHLQNPWPSYGYGCLYWKQVICNKLLKLNINSMEFSTVSLPPHYKNRDIIVVEAGEGRIGMFSLIRGPGNPQPLHYSTGQNEGENANEHPVETTIQLPDECDLYHIDGAAEGYIFLLGCRRDLTPISAFFSLEIKTMKVERVCLSNGVPHHLIPYFGFPPVMSLRRT